MKLSFIEIEGFRGIKEKVKIDFGSGFTVISGRNGTGKSSICDAIEFALSGQIRSNSISEQGENISDYIWWCGHGKPNKYFVSLGFLNDSGEEFEISRTRDGISSNINLVDILFKKQLVPADPITQLLKTTIIRDEEITKISIDLKEKDRFNFVRNTVGMENLKQYESKARELFNKIKEQVNNLVAKYDEYRKQVTDLTIEASEIRAESINERNIIDAENIIKKYLQSNIISKADFIKLANEKAIDFTQTKNSINDIINESEIVLNQLKNIEQDEFLNDISNREIKIQELKNEFAACQKEIEHIKPLLSALEKQNPRLTSLSLIHNHGKSIGLDNGKCPLCGSMISEKDFEKHLELIDKTVKDSLETLSDLIQKNIRYSENIKNLESSLANENMELEALLNRRKIIDSRLEDLNKRLRMLNLDFNVRDRELLISKVSEIDLQINELRNSINTLQVSRSFEKFNRFRQTIKYF